MSDSVSPAIAAAPAATAAPAAVAAPKKAVKRIAGIDLAEAICILIVVVYHLSATSYKLLDVPNPNVVTVFNYYVRCFYSAGCPIFFMANGYLLFSHGFKLKKHMMKTLRMALLTLFWMLASFIEINLVRGDPLTLKGLWMTWRTFRGTAIHLWYMGALVVIYLFFPLMKIAYDKDKRIFLAFFLFVFIANFGNRLVNQLITVYCYYFQGYRGPEKTTVWLSVFNLFGTRNGLALSYFGIGGVLQNIIDFMQKKLPKKAIRNTVLTAAMLLSAVLHGLWFLFVNICQGSYECPVWYGFNTVTNLVIAVCMLLLCLNYQGVHPKPLALITLVSNYTLSVYLLHEFFVQPLKLLMPIYTPWLCNLTGNIVISCIIMAVCIGIAKIFQKTPFLRKLL